MLTASQMHDLVKGDEGYNVDFKRIVPTMLKEISDEVVGFANASGSYVLIGVDDDKPLILGSFSRMHIVETVGSGVPRMRGLMKEAGLPEPELENNAFFTVTFMKRSKPQNATDSALNETEKQVLNHMSISPGVSANALIQKNE